MKFSLLLSAQCMTSKLATSAFPRRTFVTWEGYIWEAKNYAYQWMMSFQYGGYFIRKCNQPLYLITAQKSSYELEFDAYWEREWFRAKVPPDPAQTPTNELQHITELQTPSATADLCPEGSLTFHCGAKCEIFSNSTTAIWWARKHHITASGAIHCPSSQYSF